MSSARRPEGPTLVTRKVFLRRLAGGGLMLSLAACGGGGGEEGEAPSMAACEDVTFSDNHGHALAIPDADLDSVSAKTYSIRGTALHDHEVTLSPAQLAQLKARQGISVTSTMAGLTAHTHTMTATCS